ncbi:MAG: hypothetical protein ABI810_11385 [Sphingomonas bacterium]
MTQPKHRGTDIGRHLFAPADHDRHLGMGRGENPPALTTIAGGAAIERLLDPGVCDPAALSDGVGEIGMAAAPAPQGCDVDLEEAGDLARLGAESAELAGMGGEHRVVGWRVWLRGAGRGRSARRRKFPVIGGFYFFWAVFGGFVLFFAFRISSLPANSLIIRNREFSSVEQGILLDGTGNSALPIAGIDRGERSGWRMALGQAEGGV